ncbi:MAG: DNA-directed RNA polymerase II subunit L [Watsoniomyces obsoletus]|nr:MAG: DNA-directed RNA polymerase II subunit L [Watsoniomyces obsoletus]
MTSLKRTQAGGPQTSNILSKVFVRNKKSGRAQKVVLEVYLREDIPCSSKLCGLCTPQALADSNNDAIQFVLSDRPTPSQRFPNGHYLVPDTNALLNGLDLFEQTTAFYDVIILQTVLEELRNRSLPLYNRVLGLTRSEEKRFYVFFNDFRLETHVRREAGETINDRNDRAVRRAVQWYGEHLAQSVSQGRTCPAIIMLSDDKENLQKAKALDLQGMSLEDYVSGLDDANRLLDMISTKDQKALVLNTAPAASFYPEYYSSSKMMTGVKAGTLHEGVFNASPYNFLEGSVSVPAFERPLLLLGRENINRAIQGDVVVVKVLPKEQWKAPSSKIIEEETITRDDNADAEEDGEAIVTRSERRALQEEVKKVHGQSREGRPQPTARVVGITKLNWRQYVGHIDPTSVSQSVRQSRRQQTAFLLPMDRRVPKIRLQTRQAGELLGKRVLVTIDKWPRESRYPLGHFVRALGEVESKAAETEALLLEHDVQYRPFPTAVLDCLPKEGHDWRVPSDIHDPGWQGRRDLRELLVCSIDPPGCQDIDDALHARVLANGNIEVGVHIADVSHFVKPDTAMDREASARGTTVYLVDKRIDMLPMLLGTDLCSLKPYVERYAFSTIWELNPETAGVVKVEFTKSVIRSREAFSYEQAQKRIDDTKKQDELTTGMRLLMGLSKKLRQKRMDAGALNLASPEVRIQTESETSDPVDVETKKMLDTNSLVEEFMLLANISVAEKIQKAYPLTALLRRHPTPPSSSFDELSQQLKVRRGFVLDVTSSKALAESLDLCIDVDEPFFNTLIRILATRCMTSAEYFAAGSHREPNAFRHYGLASEIYTHFTSPIRRYADLVVHRQLHSALLSTTSTSTTQSEGIIMQWDLRILEDICQNLNKRHRNAQLAGRASLEYYVGQALKSRGLSLSPRRAGAAGGSQGSNNTSPTSRNRAITGGTSSSGGGSSVGSPAKKSGGSSAGSPVKKRNRGNTNATATTMSNEDGGDGGGEGEDTQEAFIMRIFSNGIVVYVPRFGIEGVVKVEAIRQSLVTSSLSSTDLGDGNGRIEEENEDVEMTDANADGDIQEEKNKEKETETRFDAEEYTLEIIVGDNSGSGGDREKRVKRIKLEMFGKVLVSVKDERDESSGKRKVRMELIL